MRIEILNSIKHFSNQPTEIELKKILVQLESTIEEEFFWICATGENSVLIYDLVCSQNEDYFLRKFKDLNDIDNYTHIHFRIFRFLVGVSKELDKQSDLFKNINETILFLIGILENDFKKSKPQIAFFVSEIILELPISILTERHLSFLAYFSLSNSVSFIGGAIIEKFIPRIVQEKNAKLLYTVLDKLVFNIKPEDYSEEFANARYDGYHVSQMLDEQRISSFCELIGPNVLLEFTIGKMEPIIKRVPFNFSHLNIPAIEDSSQTLDKNKYEFILVKFLRIQMEVNDISVELINSFFKSEYSIFNRLGVYYINIKYRTSKDIFWAAAKPQLFINPEIKHELFMLLKENANYFSINEISQLISVFDQMKDIIINDTLSKDELVQYNLSLAKEYLLAFDECTTEIKGLVEEKLSEINKVIPWEIVSPGNNSYFKHIVAKDKDREEYSETFNTTDLPKYFDIAEAGFKGLQERDALKIVNRINYLFRNNIPFILQNQDRLIKMGMENFYEVPSFFEKAWFDKLNIDWGEVFIFFGKIIDANYQKKPSAYEYFIAYSAWFIRSATKDDQHALDGRALDEAKNLCLKFLSLEIHNERLNKDPFFDILNSTDGKIYDATLEVLLRNARLNKKKEDKNKWYVDIQDFYTSLLNDNRQTDATIWSISMHLPQFGYLDMDWLREHINQIFPKENEELWLLAMRGYHKYCNQVYKVIYDLLLENGHYDLALKKFKDDREGTEDIYEHIVMSFVVNWEGSEIENPDSLIYKTLHEGNRSQIQGLIHYFLKNKNFPQSKMLELWNAIINTSSIRSELVYNDLLLLFTSLKTLDEKAFDLTCQTMKGISTTSILHRMVNSLLEMEAGDPIFRAKLLLQINEPDFEVFYEGDRGFEKLSREVMRKDPIFGRAFIGKMIEKRLFNLLDLLPN